MQGSSRFEFTGDGQADRDEPRPVAEQPQPSERSAAVLLPDETAARFFDKLRLLAGFGLASDSRLLLDNQRKDP